MITQELVPAVNPQDLKTLWNLKEDGEALWALYRTNDLSHIRGADGTSLYSDFFFRLANGTEESRNIVFRFAMFANTFDLNKTGKLVLPGVVDGKPSDAIFKAFAVVPMKLFVPDVEFDHPPFDMNELLHLIEE